MLNFDATTREIQIDGVRIHYNEAGRGPVLFAFHGGGPGANAWDNTKWNLEALARHFRVILMDLPGYGRSHHVEALENESIEAMHARVIGAFMDKLAIDRAHFYGTSMSAGSVIVFTHAHPERVLRVVLKTPSTGANILSPTPPDGIMALLAFRDEPTRANMERVMRLFISKPGLLTKQMVDDRFDSAIAARALPPPKRPTAGFGDIRSLLPA
jgi:pimeloyl-ACP methyl ester carboxylesterase